MSAQAATRGDVSGRFRGEFHDLPGAGRPIPGAGQPNDELWWVRAPADRVRWLRAGGLTPPLGRTYQVLSAGSRSGTFAAVSGQNPPNGTYHEVAYTPTSVTLTVRALPVVNVSDAVIIEGASGTSTLGFQVSLDTASSQEVRVDYATGDGTAVAGSDYTATSGTLIFAPATTLRRCPRSPPSSPARSGRAPPGGCSRCPAATSPAAPRSAFRVPG